MVQEVAFIVCIILFNPINDSIGIRIAILSCVQCIDDTYHIIRTMSIYDGGEIVYNFNKKKSLRPLVAV